MNNSFSGSANIVDRVNGEDRKIHLVTNIDEIELMTFNSIKYYSYAEAVEELNRRFDYMNPDPFEDIGLIWIEKDENDFDTYGFHAYDIIHTHKRRADLEYTSFNITNLGENRSMKAVYSNNKLTFYYDELSHIGEGTIYNVINDDDQPWQTAVSSIIANVYTVEFTASCANAKPVKCKNWFKNFTALISVVGMQYLNTISCTTMEGMFYNCTSLRTLDCRYFNLSSVETFKQIFYGCENLEAIYTTNKATATLKNQWQTVSTASAADRYDYMFSGCSSLPNFSSSDVDNSRAYAGTYRGVDGYFIYSSLEG